MNILSKAVHDNAIEYLGHTEVTRNDSPLIREWLRRCGIKKPAAWCAAFASCMVDDACADVGVPNMMPMTASARGLLRHAKRLGLWTAEPVYGAVFGIRHPRGKGHVGIVYDVRKDSVGTIEGNTNADGSREGNMVRLRVRRIDEIDLGYFDPSLMIR